MIPRSRLLAGAGWAAAALVAGRALAAEPGTVSTHATARDRLPNTVADVTVQIEAQARALADVQRLLSTNSTALLAYLQTSGATRTGTQAVTVEPQTEENPPRGQAPRIVGYLGHVVVTFRIGADALGSVLGGVLNHGANSIQETVLHPRQEELGAKRQSLAAQATRQALEEARVVAEAAGRRLGAVRALDLDAAAPAAPPSYPTMAMAASPAPAMGRPVATESGETEVTATVSATVALVEPDAGAAPSPGPAPR